MALTKVKGSGVEGITNLSNATFLSVDASEVATLLTSAVINSEGGAVTTNIAQGLAKAWVNLNGTGTAALRDSYNVSGITDNGAGDYTTTWATAMSNGNYSVAHMINRSNDALRGGQWCCYAVTQEAGNEPSAAALRINTGASAKSTANGLVEDQQYITLTVMGDLA